MDPDYPKFTVLVHYAQVHRLERYKYCTYYCSRCSLLNKGTFILVSHDRYFISKTANKIWYIEDKKIKEFVGTYDEYVVFEQEREKRKQQKAAAPVVQEEKPKEKKHTKNKINNQPKKNNKCTQKVSWR